MGGMEPPEVDEARRVLGLPPLAAEFSGIGRLLRGISDGRWTEDDVRRIAKGNKGGGQFTEKPRAFRPEPQARAGLSPTRRMRRPPERTSSVPSVELIRQQAAIARPGNLDDLLAVGDMARRRADEAAKAEGLDSKVEPVTYDEIKAARSARLKANLDTLHEIAGSADPEVLRPKVEAGVARFDEQYPGGTEVLGMSVSQIRPSGKRRMIEAMSRFPKEWQPAVERIFDSSAIGASMERAFFQTETGKASPNLIAAPIGSILNGIPAEAITLHEIGHGLEHEIEGLMEAQAEYWKRRVGRNQSYNFEDGGNFPADPENPTKDRYSMKRYEDGAAEFFSTGVEDLLGSGAMHMLGGSQPGETDEDFENFIWGVLLTLKPKQP